MRLANCFQFNESRISERGLAGDLTVEVRSSVPSPARAGQWTGTLSQEVEYYESPRRLIAICHRYLRVDGTLGGSGLPDPKWLLVEEEIWLLAHRGGDTCAECNTWRARNAGILV